MSELLRSQHEFLPPQGRACRNSGRAPVGAQWSWEQGEGQRREGAEQKQDLTQRRGAAPSSPELGMIPIQNPSARGHHLPGSRRGLPIPLCVPRTVSKLEACEPAANWRARHLRTQATNVDYA